MNTEATTPVRMRDVIIDIQEDIEEGRLTYRQIADKYQVPYNWVTDAAEMIAQFRGQLL